MLNDRHLTFKKTNKVALLPTAFSNSTRENPRRRKSVSSVGRGNICQDWISGGNKFCNLPVRRLPNFSDWSSKPRGSRFKVLFFFPFTFQFAYWIQAKTFRWLNFSLHKMKTILAISHIEVMRINLSIKHLKVFAIKIKTTYKIVVFYRCEFARPVTLKLFIF